MATPCSGWPRGRSNDRNRYLCCALRAGATSCRSSMLAFLRAWSTMHSSQLTAHSYSLPSSICSSLAMKDCPDGRPIEAQKRGDTFGRGHIRATAAAKTEWAIQRPGYSGFKMLQERIGGAFEPLGRERWAPLGWTAGPSPLLADECSPCRRCSRRS